MEHDHIFLLSKKTSHASSSSICFVPQVKPADDSDAARQQNKHPEVNPSILKKLMSVQSLTLMSNSTQQLNTATQHSNSTQQLNTGHTLEKIIMHSYSRHCCHVTVLMTLTYGTTNSPLLIDNNAYVWHCAYGTRHCVLHMTLCIWQYTIHFAHGTVLKYLRTDCTELYD